MAVIATVVVAAGVILNPTKSHVLLSFRHPHLDQGGLWEYPGGKVEAGESGQCALARELKEELAITPLHSCLLSMVEHDYGPKRVKLHFYIVEAYSGHPRALESQLIEWCPVEQLHSKSFPAANQPVAAQLQQWLSKQNPQ